MHRSLLFALLVCLCVSTVNAADAPQVTEIAQGVRHDALFGLCLNGSRGIAVGDAGVVMQTDDSGENWQSLASFTDSALLDVNCRQGAQFIVGQQGLIFRRDGQQFEKLESGSDQRLMSVSANNNGLVFAVGGFGTVLRSQDGGDHWETIAFDWEAILNDFVEPHLYSVHLTEDGVVTIAGEFALILRSDDRGANWQVKHRGEASLFGMSVMGSKAYAVGQDGTMLRSDDGGVSWKPVRLPSGANLLDVWFSEQGQIVASGIRAVLHSSDAGQSWQTVDASDFNAGWYQRIAASGASDQSSSSLLLAGHSGRIVKLLMNSD